MKYLDWKVIFLKAIFDNDLYEEDSYLTIDMLNDAKKYVLQQINNVNCYSSFTRDYYIFESDVLNNKYIERIQKYYPWAINKGNRFLIDHDATSPYNDYQYFPFTAPKGKTDIKEHIRKLYGREITALLFINKKNKSNEMEK